MPLKRSSSCESASRQSLRSLKTFLFRVVKSEKISVKTPEEFADAPTLRITSISSNYPTVSPPIPEIYKLHRKLSVEKVLY